MKDPKKALASTVKHELLHWKNPKKSETKIRKMEKSSAKRMTPQQQNRLLAKLK